MIRYYGPNDEAGISLNCSCQRRGGYILRHLRKAFEDLRPRLPEKFDIRSILTLCAENVFSEMRSCATVPLQLAFDRRFPRALRERVLGRLYVTCLQSTIQELYDLNSFDSTVQSNSNTSSKTIIHFQLDIIIFIASLKFLYRQGIRFPASFPCLSFPVPFLYIAPTKAVLTGLKAY